MSKPMKVKNKKVECLWISYWTTLL